MTAKASGRSRARFRRGTSSYLKGRLPACLTASTSDIVADAVSRSLEQLGLAHHATASSHGVISMDVLCEFGHEVPKELGMSLPRHRLRILKVARACGDAPAAAAQKPVITSPTQPDVDVRRRALAAEGEGQDVVLYCEAGIFETALRLVTNVGAPLLQARAGVDQASG